MNYGESRDFFGKPLDVLLRATVHGQAVLRARSTLQTTDSTTPIASNNWRGISSAFSASAM